MAESPFASVLHQLSDSGGDVAYKALAEDSDGQCPVGDDRTTAFKALLQKVSQEYQFITTQCATLQAENDALLAAQGTPQSLHSRLPPTPQSAGTAPARLEDVQLMGIDEHAVASNGSLDEEASTSIRVSTASASRQQSPTTLCRNTSKSTTDSETCSKERSHFQKLVQKEKSDLDETFRCAFVKGQSFSFLTAVAIVANSVYIGITTNIMVQAEFERLEGREITDVSSLQYGDAFFCVFFSLELIFRAFADRLLFITGKEQKWNLFDFIVVVFSILDLVTQLVNIDIGLRVSFLRVIRIVRLLRVLKVATHSPFIQSLKTMLYSIGGTSHSFITAIILLFCIMYIAALVFMGAILNHLEEISIDDVNNAKNTMFVGQVKAQYGTIEGTIWTLFASVTGGYDWAGPAETLMELGSVYTWCFLLYISFALFVVLNILNGIFVNVALQSSAMNRQLAIDAAMKKRESMISEMVDIFLEAGIDGREDEFEGGEDRVIKVSWEQFQQRLCDEGMKAYFMAMDLDTEALRRIFLLLDTQENGKLDLEVFINGCIRLQGSAKMVDISILETIAQNTLGQVATLDAIIRNRLDHFDNHIAVVDREMLEIDRHMSDIDKHLLNSQQKQVQQQVLQDMDISVPKGRSSL